MTYLAERAGASVVRRLAAPVAVLFALLAVGYALFDELGAGPRAAGPPAVLLAAPAGYRMLEGGELARSEAARRLAAALDANPAEARLGLHFTSAGFELYWLADRGEPAAPGLVELSAGPTGTRVETRYPGPPAPRLAFAADGGRLDLPGAPPPEARNLYH
jgi:hypothetical protein